MTEMAQLLKHHIVKLLPNGSKNPNTLLNSTDSLPEIVSRGNAVAVNLMAVQIHVKICCIQSINFLFFVFIVPYHE